MQEATTQKIASDHGMIKVVTQEPPGVFENTRGPNDVSYNRTFNTLLGINLGQFNGTFVSQVGLSNTHNTVIQMAQTHIQYKFTKLAVELQPLYWEHAENTRVDGQPKQWRSQPILEVGMVGWSQRNTSNIRGDLNEIPGYKSGMFQIPTRGPPTTRFTVTGTDLNKPYLPNRQYDNVLPINQIGKISCTINPVTPQHDSDPNLLSSDDWRGCRHDGTGGTDTRQWGNVYYHFNLLTNIKNEVVANNFINTTTNNITNNDVKLIFNVRLTYQVEFTGWSGFPYTTITSTKRELEDARRIACCTPCYSDSEYRAEPKEPREPVPSLGTDTAECREDQLGENSEADGRKLQKYSEVCKAGAKRDIRAKGAPYALPSKLRKAKDQAIPVRYD